MTRLLLVPMVALVLAQATEATRLLPADQRGAYPSARR
jgi:hypothetical protein